MTEQVEHSRSKQTVPLGTVIDGRYKVVSLISSGGFGEIYKVSHVELNEIRAAKLLRPSALNETVFKRFQREAKVLCKLDHPNLLKVHTFGIDHGVGPYLIMSYAQGQPLSELLKAQSLTINQVREIASQVCDGLQYAHDNGVLHRDLKPANIMIDQTDEGLHATIIDFGAAKILAGDDQRLTKTAAVLGTPIYMSPEQFRSTTIDLRSDIYSLGCVLYECLVGQPPFEGETAVALMHAHCTQPPDLEPVPAPMRALVAKCLDKDPSTRFTSAMEVRQALQHPSAVRMPAYSQTSKNNDDTLLLYGVRSRPKTPKATPKALKILTAACLLMMVIALAAFAVMRYNQQQEADQITHQAAAEVSGEEALRYLPLREKYFSYTNRRKFNDAYRVARLLATKVSSDDHGDLADIYVYISSAAANLRRYQEAEEWIKQSIAESKKEGTTYVEAELQRVSNLANEGRLAEAQAEARQALKLFPDLSPSGRERLQPYLDAKLN